jgi:hypothetical protein
LRCTLVAVLITVPVTFMHLPTLLIVVIMWMAPLSALVRRTLPGAASPYVTAAFISPIAFLPNIALARHCRANFAAKWRWVATDVNPDLADCRCGESSKR